MSEYNMTELEKMQQRAMDRVNEMKRKSDILVNRADNPIQKQMKPYQVKTTVTTMEADLPQNKLYNDFDSYFENNRNEKSRSNSNFDMEEIILRGIYSQLKHQNAKKELLIAIKYIMR